MTVGELIDKLKEYGEDHGYDADVALDDPDTGYLLPIHVVTEGFATYSEYRAKAEASFVLTASYEESDVYSSEPTTD